jgi:hypothetical protein
MIVFDQDNSTVLTNLGELNDALRKLNPEITGISSDMLETPGNSVRFLNLAITQNQTSIWNGMTRGELLDLLRPTLVNVINTEVPNFTYDPHGEKHFLGGPPGTKFTAPKGTVNPILEQILLANIGRIRRHANGVKTTYYLTQAGIAQCPPGHSLTIQLTFDYSDYGTDTIDYHGYPDDSVTTYSLATSKGGTDIP